MRFERTVPGEPSCCPDTGHRPLTSVRFFGIIPFREKGSKGFSGPFFRTPLALDLLIVWMMDYKESGGDFKECVPP
jgi:hypothetical protein